jgi:hypothetical protein
VRDDFTKLKKIHSGKRADDALKKIIPKTSETAEYPHCLEGSVAITDAITPAAWQYSPLRVAGSMASIFSGSRRDGIYTSLVRILTLNFLHTCVRANAGLNLV